MKKRIFTLFLALCMALALLPGVQAAEVVASGTCGAEGDNVTWTYDSDDVLTISGTGAMAKGYDLWNPTPWAAQAALCRAVRIEDGVTSVAAQAFYKMPELVSAFLADSVREIGENTFCECLKLRQIRLPEELAAIPAGMFSGCTSLEAIDLPDGVETIGWNAFAGCTALRSIDIPDAVREIEDMTFAGCTALADVQFPANLKQIGYDAFYFCSALRYVSFPEGFETVGEEAFLASGVEEVVLPDSIHKFGFGAFESCRNLKYVYFPKASSEFWCDNYVFHNCTSLRSVTLPEGIRWIGDGTFQGCASLEVVAFPASVESIYLNAFSGCTSLAAVLYTGTEEQLMKILVSETGNDAFFNADFYLIPSLPDPVYGFFDLPARGSWAYPGISYCLDNGLMNGMSAMTFEPNGTMTRAMLVTILWRQAGEPQAAQSCPFTDLTQSWYQQAVAWAAETGVVKGMSATKFAPNAPVTREQFATILYRYAGLTGADVSGAAALSAFPDGGSVSDYAEAAMAWAVDAGLINGVREHGVDYLRPRQGATRAQAATMLMRFCERCAA